MALDAKSNLEATVLRWIRRPDLAAEVSDWIALAEAQMQRRLRVSSMIGQTDLSISDGYVSLPDDFAGIRSFDLDTNPPQSLDFASAREMVRRGSVYFAAGKPSTFAVVGNELQFSPSPDATFTGRLSYWQRIPPLTDAEPSNWLLEQHPDAYLYGTLLQSAPFLKADERINTWGTLFVQALSDIEADDARRNYGAFVAARARSLG